MKKHLLLLCLSVAWLFTGCASVDLASDADSAKAKEFRFFPLIGVIFGIENKKKKGIY